MSRHPTLDELESGHTHHTAYLAGDFDALDAIDTANHDTAEEMAT